MGYGRKTLLLPAAAALILVASLLGPAETIAKGPRAGKSVVGGRFVGDGSLPYMASITTPSTLCSGAVIAPTRVLTAAHCVTNPAEMTVRVGSPFSWTGGQTVGASSAVVHPGFAITRGGSINDIAVIKLVAPVSVTPIQLPTGSEDAALTTGGSGTPLTVAGYGRSQPDARRKPRSDTLRAVAQLSTPNSCYGYDSYSPVTNVCTVGRRFGTAIQLTRKYIIVAKVFKAPCSGDSGGPLIADSAVGPRLVGVFTTSGVSPRPFGFVACGFQRLRNIYTRTSAYLPFIQAQL